ncbi:MAG: RICIN domain-containing protein [Chitinophagaceae bacterium]|nr:RICIN domain-containing protein [Oligoflexus sp.]
MLYSSFLFTIAAVFPSLSYAIGNNSPAIPGVFEIVSKSSAKYLDVFNHSLADNAGLAQWACTHEPHQRFKLGLCAEISLTI